MLRHGGEHRIVVLTAMQTGIFAAKFLRICSAANTQERLSRVATDLAVRQAHWADALAMRDPGLITDLLGMGIGRFPDTHYWRRSEARAASYRLLSEQGNRFLRLGTGTAMYTEQFVTIEPGLRYVVQLDLRFPQADGGVAVSLCEKWLLTSGRCVAATATAAQGGSEWQRHELRLASGEIGGVWTPRRAEAAMSASSKNLRLACAQQSASVTGAGERSDA